MQILEEKKIANITFVPYPTSFNIFQSKSKKGGKGRGEPFNHFLVENCTWNSVVGYYSGGYANGISTVYTVDQAKEECKKLTACKYVTCRRGNNHCTLRSSDTLKNSSSGEISFWYICNGGKNLFEY